MNSSQQPRLTRVLFGGVSAGASSAGAVARGVRPGRDAALTLWAWARGGRALDSTIFQDLDSSTRERHSLLEGLVAASLFRKSRT